MRSLVTFELDELLIFVEPDVELIMNVYNERVFSGLPPVSGGFHCCDMVDL